MDITRKTSGITIAEEFAKKLSAADKRSLATAIDKLVEVATEGALNTDFEQRLSRQAGKKAENWYIPPGVRENISDIADMLPVEARANLMRIGYSEVLELKKIHEGGVFNELRELLKQPLVGREFGEPFDFDNILDYMGEKPADDFLRLLKQNKISKTRAQSVIDEINKSYYLKEEEVEL